MEEMKSFAPQSGSANNAQRPGQMPGTAGLSDAEIKRQQEAEKKWEKAGISNDFIFYKVMTENHDLCLELTHTCM